MDIEETLRKHRDELMQRPGVVGVGIGDDPQGGRVILVMVTRLDSPSVGQLPEFLEGYRVVVQEVGDVSAL